MKEALKILVVFCLVLVVGCGKRKKIRITGTVYDKETLNPIEDARVVLTKDDCCSDCNKLIIDEMQTGENGKYEFNFVWRDASWIAQAGSDSYTSPNYKVYTQFFSEIDNNDNEGDWTRKNGSILVKDDEKRQQINFELSDIQYSNITFIDTSSLDSIKNVLIEYMPENDYYHDHCGIRTYESGTYQIDQQNIVLPCGKVHVKFLDVSGTRIKSSEFDIPRCNWPDTCQIEIVY